MDKIKKSSPEPNLAQSIFGWREFKFVQTKGHSLFHIDITKRAKTHGRNLKISRTNGLISTKLGAKYLWNKRNSTLLKEMTTFYSKGKKRNTENTLTTLITLLLPNHLTNFNQFWHKASLGEEDSISFKWRTRPFSRGIILK